MSDLEDEISEVSQEDQFKIIEVVQRKKGAMLATFRTYETMQEELKNIFLSTNVIFNQIITKFYYMKSCDSKVERGKNDNEFMIFCSKIKILKIPSI